MKIKIIAADVKAGDFVLDDVFGGYSEVISSSKRGDQVDLDLVAAGNTYPYMWDEKLEVVR